MPPKLEVIIVHRQSEDSPDASPELGRPAEQICAVKGPANLQEGVLEISRGGTVICRTLYSPSCGDSGGGAVGGGILTRWINGTANAAFYHLWEGECKILHSL